MHFNKYLTLSFNHLQLIQRNSEASNTFFDKGGGSQGTGSSFSSSFLLAWLSLSIGKKPNGADATEWKMKNRSRPFKATSSAAPRSFHLFFFPFSFLPRQQVVKHEKKQKKQDAGPRNKSMEGCFVYDSQRFFFSRSNV